MNKSFLFNITNQEGLPGGANETKSNLLGSVSISQQTSIPQFNTRGVTYADLTDEEIEQYRKGGWIIEEYAEGGEKDIVDPVVKKPSRYQEPVVNPTAYISGYRGDDSKMYKYGFLDSNQGNIIAGGGLGFPKPGIHLNASGVLPISSMDRQYFKGGYKAGISKDIKNLNLGLELDTNISGYPGENGFVRDPLKIQPTLNLKYNFQDGGYIAEQYDKGGLFTKKKSSSEYKPGAWANAETSTDKIYTEGEDAFDMPISKVPEAEFAVQDMSEEELQAYLQKSEQQAFQEKYQQAYDQYKPKSVSYKNVERPSAEFVLKETYENNPQAFTDAGYTASQLESGNYELFSNQDISNMIYKKGFSPDVLSNTFGIGKSEELETKFSPVYADAKRIHAKRNAEKIDNLVKQGYDVKGAIQELANQGEGTVEGLTKRYNDYATESYNEENYSKQLAEKVNQQYNDKVSKDIEDLRSNVLSFDKNSIASVDQPIMTANYDMQGNITGYGDNTAYTRNVNALAELSNYEDNLQQAPERIARDAMLALANSDLTNDQKRTLLSNPEKLTNLMQEYGAWEQADEGFAPSGDVGYYRGGRFKSPFRITAEGDAEWTEGEAPRVIDGGVNMLDKQWIKGTLGVLAAPAAFEALGSAMSYSAADAGLLSAGRIGSALNAGNVFTGMGVYDVATDIAPDAYNQVVDMTQHGVTKDNLLGLGKDVIEGGTKLLSGTKLLNEVGILSKAPSITKLQAYKTGKDLYAQGKYGSRVAAEELTGEAYNVKDNMKFIKSLAPFMKKQEGGVTYTELTDEEIKAYREGGWIIEEM